MKAAGPDVPGQDDVQSGFQETAVAYYRLYFKVEGHIRDVAEFVCDDDADALELATAARDRREMELWELGRLVASWEALSHPQPTSAPARSPTGDMLRSRSDRCVSPAPHGDTHQFQSNWSMSPIARLIRRARSAPARR
jgi:hypothetical protein